MPEVTEQFVIKRGNEFYSAHDVCWTRDKYRAIVYTTKAVADFALNEIWDTGNDKPVFYTIRPYPQKIIYEWEPPYPNDPYMSMANPVEKYRVVDSEDTNVSRKIVVYRLKNDSMWVPIINDEDLFITQRLVRHLVELTITA